MKLSIIFAMEALSGRIGLHNGHLPWSKIKTDMDYFRENTMNHICLMGRKTWDTLPSLLKGRTHWVIGTSVQETPTKKPDRIWSSWSQWLQDYRNIYENKNGIVWIIGGKTIYEQAWNDLREEIDEVHWTTVHVPDDLKKPIHEQDVFWKPVPCLLNPTLWDSHGEVITDIRENRYHVSIRKYVNESKLQHQHPEYQYLDLIKNVLKNGTTVSNRTGIPTKRIWGAMTRWDLQKGFPLFTTKKVFWKGVVEEALWFLQGQTDATLLNNKGVRIWNDNGTREFLDSRGLTEYPEGVLGPVYGWQWRRFNVPYDPLDTNKEYSLKNDQITTVLRLLKETPDTRRAIVSAWNPLQLDEMALPPCHVLFHLEGEPLGSASGWKLNLLFYQRSADLGLGVPFNVASYALLTHIFAHQLGWEVGEVVQMIGDAHVYVNHEDALQQQIQRKPYPFPTLKLNIPESVVFGINDYRMEHFVLENYRYHEKLMMKMAV